MARARGRKPPQLNRKGFELLIPSAQALDAERRKLPTFEPWDTNKLLSEAQARKNQYATKDDAINKLCGERKQRQLFELMERLEIKPTEKFGGWKAFIKLAEIHHNVGRLVHRPTSSKAHSKEWSSRDEFELLYWVDQLVQTGLSERGAVELIADEQLFPYHERGARERHAGEPSRVARRNALWRKYQRVKPSKDSLCDSQSLARAMGTVQESAFEGYLSTLVTDWLLTPFTGDKPPRLKRRTFKSPRR